MPQISLRRQRQLRAQPTSQVQPQLTDIRMSVNWGAVCSRALEPDMLVVAIKAIRFVEAAWPPQCGSGSLLPVR